ncbi:MAG: putative Ig domain-containing protein [Cyclobacteriaceae bacterium]|nr:putative Ig domain-containing protein [Cyclobacteriaceae bacterium]
MKTRIFLPYLILLIIIASGCGSNPPHPYQPLNETILTPKPPATPRINGPSVYGVRPGSPFIYRIPCTGDRPIHFQAINLPAGLTLNGSTGIITGRLETSGKYMLQIEAKNTSGGDSREFTIVAGDTLALTPPMGWNSWYIHYDRISDSLMRQAADQMIETGMADFGYQYVNIDDCWMVKVNPGDPDGDSKTRSEDGKLLTNEKFPDMYALTEYIHGKGLKAGTYISPGPTTCAGYAGSYGHEHQDAETFAEWGFDFLKYDWCSYGRLADPVSTEDYIKPYRQMWQFLRSLDRDIVLNLCQYGMGDVWTWGGEVGNCWRTTGDLGLEENRELPGFYYIGLSNAQHWQYARPGSWNDPDYILIGWVGDANRMLTGASTLLTPDEQYSYMSMWSLMAAPLIFSGDMGRLDEFTLNVLCNHEVISVIQDPLGKQARILRQSEKDLVLVKEMVDGSYAVGIFNLEKVPSILNIHWEEMGIKGKWKLRDLWRQKDIGEYRDSFSASIMPHGVVMVSLKNN